MLLLLMYAKVFSQSTARSYPQCVNTTPTFLSKAIVALRVSSSLIPVMFDELPGGFIEGNPRVSGSIIATLGEAPLSMSEAKAAPSL